MRLILTGIESKQFDVFRMLMFYVCSFQAYFYHHQSWDKQQLPIIVSSHTSTPVARAHTTLLVSGTRRSHG